MLQIGNVKIDNPVFMAPMCGITHKPFRKMTKEFGAGMVYTQMVSSKALIMGDKKSRKIVEFDETERPIVIQIFGNEADTIAEGCRILQDMGPDIIDLNMGCPAKKIVSDGGGSALLKDLRLCEDIFTKVKKVLTVPFTVKMRAGWDKYHHDSLTVAKVAEACGVDAITLHARTKAQGYSGHADWNLIREFKSELKIPVIGNGDVTHFTDVKKMMGETGCDAVMVGRQGFSEPWFFKSYVEGAEYKPGVGELKKLILSQYRDFFEYFGFDGGIKMMRKHLAAYTRGMRDGSKFRNDLIRMTDWNLINERIESFFVD
ncbi:tRNA dihydrouridine synthase DusB [bacterium]|nr:tRNA dihydrouridine synthase DusB [bacterium]